MDDDSSEKDPVFDQGPRPTSPLLRRADQACVATIVVTSLVAIVAYLFAHGWHRGETIEVERADPLAVEFEVDLNSADWPELTMLPNVGETLARRIVDWRDKNGPFLDHEDLMQVPGIGPKTLQQIRDYLRPIPQTESIAGP